MQLMVKFIYPTLSGKRERNGQDELRICDISRVVEVELFQTFTSCTFRFSSRYLSSGNLANKEAQLPRDGSCSSGALEPWRSSRRLSQSFLYTIVALASY